MLLILSIIGAAIVAIITIYFLLKKQNKKVFLQFENAQKDKKNIQDLVEYANDCIIVIDIVEGNIMMANPSTCRLLGYTKQEIESLSIHQLFSESEISKGSTLVADVWEKKGMIFSELNFVTSTNESIPLECSAKVATYQNQAAIVIYARDIRKRLLLERELQQKNKDITDSIFYAERIQQDLFPAKNELQKLVPQSFLIFKPRDIVSGDFYWFQEVKTTDEKKTRLVVIAAADCTGHGVPGAMMSILGNYFLNLAARNPDVNSPADALNFINLETNNSLKSINDGMDIAMIAVDFDNMNLIFSGANNPVYIVRNDELIEIKGTKRPIGKYIDDNKKPFSNHDFSLQKNDCIYLFSDGFADQFGGPRGKKFMYKQMRELLIAVAPLTMEEQKREIENVFINWKGNLSQIDDVMMIGIRI